MDDDTTDPTRDDLTIPERRVLVETASRVSQRHVSNALTRVWVSLLIMACTLIGEVVYVAFNTGQHLQQLNANTATVLALTNARVVDETQLAAMNATLIQMQIQLNRIEDKVDGGH